MVPRVGGLWVSRKPGEMVSLFFNKDEGPKIFRYDYVDKHGAAWITFDGVKYDMIPGESIKVGDDAFYLESIEGGRAVFRFLFGDSIKIVRSELLCPGVKNDRAAANGDTVQNQGRVREHKAKGS